MNMVKRISCRVVRSVPLDKADSILCYAAWPNNNPHDADDATAADGSFKYKSDSVSYTILSNIASASVDNSLTGQFVDCYV